MTSPTHAAFSWKTFLDVQLYTLDVLLSHLWFLSSLLRQQLFLKLRWGQSGQQCIKCRLNFVFSSDPPDNVRLVTSAAGNKACRGDVITITCSADAVPSVTSYQLFENDIAILETSDSGMWTRNYTREGMFIFKCVANNSLGTGQSESVTVTVNGNFVSFSLMIVICLTNNDVLGFHVT